MALASNNPTKVDIPLNKDTKPRKAEKRREKKKREYIERHFLKERKIDKIKSIISPSFVKFLCLVAHQPSWIIYCQNHPSI